MKKSNQKLAEKMLLNCSKNKGRGSKEIFSKMIEEHVRKELSNLAKEVANETFK